MLPPAAKNLEREFDRGKALTSKRRLQISKTRFAVMASPRRVVKFARWKSARKTHLHVVSEGCPVAQ
jgi:hypothetical protein